MFRVSIMGIIIVIALSGALLGTYSCRKPSPIENVIVQVWESSTLVSNGVVVGDGSQVLTLLEYKNSTPTDLAVALRGNGPYKADVQAIDARTGVTLLAVQGSFSMSRLGDAKAIKKDQPVTVKSWSAVGDGYEINDTAARVSSTVSGPVTYLNVIAQSEMSPSRLTGSIVCDSIGGVVGLIGYDFGLIPSTHISPPGSLPRAVSMATALELLGPQSTEQPWSNGPVSFAVVTPSTAASYTELPGNYEPVSVALRELLSEVGRPLHEDELRSGYTGFPFDPSNVTALVAVYAFPVDLQNKDGNALAKAKWISIDWLPGAEGGRLFYYDAIPASQESGFALPDITGLKQVVDASTPRASDALMKSN